MKIDDDGKPHAITLDEAQKILLGLLTGATLATDADDVAHVSYAVDYGKDRGERCLLVEITHPSGVCEGFQLSLTRDLI